PPAEVARDDAAAETPLPGRLEIQHASERNDAAQGQLGPARGADRELASGGMPCEHDPLGIERPVADEIQDVGDAQVDVLLRSRPAASGIADPAVFEAPRRDSRLGQSDAQVPRMCEVVDRLPEAAVDYDDERKRPVSGGREAQVAELQRLG